MKLNAIQKAAYELIQSDARFLYTLITIQRYTKNLKSNYLMMSQPYIGLFVDGAEQWCRKMGMSAPTFSKDEKLYYSSLRQSHKLYELPYTDYLSALINKFNESNEYFYSIRSPLQKLIGYSNVGVDLYEEEFCGNTILCALYSPAVILGDENIGPWIRDISVIAGKLVAFFGCTEYEPYRCDVNAYVGYEDYHFYKKCPLNNKTDLGFLLFSILCSVNYAIIFVDRYFLDEIPQKFKLAYLQYYYLCDFISELNAVNGTRLVIHDSLKNRDFRNCLAHYGLGQYMSESDLLPNDPMKGLIQKAFAMDYLKAKEKLFLYLTELSEQIKLMI